MPRNVRTPLLFLSLGMNIAFLVVLGIFVFPDLGVGNGEKRPHDRGHHHEAKRKEDRDPGWYFYSKKLGVSDTQWADLRPPMEAYHAKAHEICEKIRSLKNRLLDLIESSGSNTESIRSTEERILDLRRKKQRMFVDYMTKKKNHLKPRQQKQFFKILRKDRKCDKHARFLEGKPSPGDGDSHDG